MKELRQTPLRQVACEGCKAPMVFIVSKETRSLPPKQQRKIPCDPPLITIEAVDAKTPGSKDIISVVLDDGSIRRGRRVDGSQATLGFGERVTGRITHFASCPVADRFRGRRK